jgi:hypothetical protein
MVQEQEQRSVTATEYPGKPGKTFGAKLSCMRAGLIGVQHHKNSDRRLQHLLHMPILRCGAFIEDGEKHAPVLVVAKQKMAGEG